MCVRVPVSMCTCMRNGAASSRMPQAFDVQSCLRVTLVQSGRAAPSLACERVQAALNARLGGRCGGEFVDSFPGEPACI